MKGNHKKIASERETIRKGISQLLKEIGMSSASKTVLQVKKPEDLSTFIRTAQGRFKQMGAGAPPKIQKSVSTAVQMLAQLEKKYKKPLKYELTKIW